MRPRALDLFCGGGGVSEGLLQAGFDVVGVDLDPKKERAYMRGPGNPERHGRPAVFVQADALTVLDQIARAQRGALAPLFEEPPFRGGFDFIWASPPCQAHSILRKLTPGKEYPDLIPGTRERLIAAGIPYAIENVPGAPLGGFLIQLCGTMFGLQTPDGRAELRRHRLFETSWPIALRPACQHGHEGIAAVIPVTGHTPVDNRGRPERDAQRRQTLSITGANPEAKVPGKWKTYPTAEERAVGRETFSTDDARHAMAIDWMAMRDLSQAIPPAYAFWLGLRALEEIASGVSLDPTGNTA